MKFCWTHKDKHIERLGSEIRNWKLTITSTQKAAENCRNIITISMTNGVKYEMLASTYNQCMQNKQNTSPGTQFNQRLGLLSWNIWGVEKQTQFQTKIAY